MESDITASSFKLSEQMHGLHHKELVSDEDSSVLHTIQTIVLPYGKYMYVTKVECANYCVKCYGSRLEQLNKDFPTLKGKGV